jgi:hypothetical protein
MLPSSSMWFEKSTTEKHIKNLVRIDVLLMLSPERIVLAGLSISWLLASLVVITLFLWVS